MGATPKPVSQDTLKRRAEFLGVDEDKYLGMNGRQQTAYKAQFIKRIRNEAKKSGGDEAEAVAKTLKSFPEDSIQVGGQTLVRVTPERRKEIEDRAARAVTGEEVFTEPMLPSNHEIQDGLKVYTTGDAEVPPQEEDPEKRDGVTIGRIVEIEKPPVADLVGDRAPRTLTDLYARWPIAEDPSYSIRVERTKPKRYGNVDVAGYVGEIRERTVKESDLHRWLGGTEYLLTVYGPDPRGKTDINNLPIIKPLTEPIKLIVPVIPPNTGAIPAMQGQGANMSNNNSNPMNPFAPQGGTTLTNQHDAAIHKTNTDFASNMIKMQKETENRDVAGKRTESAGIFQFLAESQKTAAQTAAAQAAAAERVEERLRTEAKEARDKAETSAQEIARQYEEKTGQGFDINALQKILHTVGPNREAESQRQGEYYRMQMETMKNSHEDSMRQLRDRHSEELRRSDERAKDNEDFHKRTLEEERVKSNDREKSMREEIDKIRREERELAKQRTEETKDRYTAEARQMERSHERELRTLKDSFDIKVDVADRTHNMHLTQVSERLTEAQADAERAREEAKESSDPVKVMEKAKSQAEAMGFEKKDNDAPKTPLERFAATAGAGLSQAFGTIDQWGPQILAARQGIAAPPAQPNVRQLGGAPQPQAQQPQAQRVPAQQQTEQPQARRPARRRSRVAAWSTEEVSVSPPEMPSTPLGFQTPETTQKEEIETTAEQFVEAVEVDTPTEGQQTQIEVPQPQVESQPNPSMAEQGYIIPEKILSIFSEEAIMGFLGQAEHSIGGGIDPTVFGEQFFAQYPEEAAKLIMNFEPTELVDMVKSFPNTESSPLVMRDGEKWMDGLWDYGKERIEKQTTQTA